MWNISLHSVSVFYAVSAKDGVMSCLLVKPTFGGGSDGLPGGWGTAVPDSLVAEINHQVGNSLSMIAGLVRLQAAEVSKAGRSLSGQEAAQQMQEMGSR